MATAARIRQPFQPSSALARLGPGARAALAGLCLCALAIFLARAPLTLCVALILGVAGLIALVLRPYVGLYALALAIPFGSLREFQLGGMSVGASQALVLAVMGAWLLHMAVHRRVRLARSRLTGALLLFLFTTCISLLPAQALAPALKELAKWVSFVAVYLCVASDTRPADRDRLTAALLLGGTLEAGLGIYQFMTGSGPEGFILFGRYMRAYGTFQQPNPYGGYLGTLLPLAYTTALYRFSDGVRGWRSKHRGQTLLWLLSVVAAISMAAALAMSWSRGALLGFAAGVAVVLLAMGRRAWVVVLVAGLVVLLLSPVLLPLVPSSYTQRLTDSAQYFAGTDLAAVEVTTDNFAAVERAAHWLAAWRMFSSHPWLGVGTGQYATVYPQVALPKWSDPLGHAHNYYLNILAEGGLVGLAAYLIWFVAAIVLCWRRAAAVVCDAVGSSVQRGLALAALGALVHLGVHSVVDNLYVHEIYLVVAALLGLVVAGSHPIIAINTSTVKNDAAHCAGESLRSR